MALTGFTHTRFGKGLTVTIPGTEPRRTMDVISNTIVAVAVTIGATVLGVEHILAPEGILAAYGIAAAVSGLPIVVKRGP